MRRVGIYGGTFNPPHVGHIEAAKAFITQAKLDTLIIMPAFIPPHKQTDNLVNCDDRLEMCRLAFGNITNTEISDLEISRGGKSYTYLTLQELASDDTELYFLCGTDMILTMDTWKNPEIIFTLAKICYIRRESDNAISELLIEKCGDYFQKYGADIIQINTEAIEISSSEIRAEDGIWDRYLTANVIDYIRNQGLYK
jgi:nicotinate-nucleotide adenylyltransferase